MSRLRLILAIALAAALAIAIGLFVDSQCRDVAPAPPVSEETPPPAHRPSLSPTPVVSMPRELVHIVDASPGEETILLSEHDAIVESLRGRIAHLEFELRQVSSIPTAAMLADIGVKAANGEKLTANEIQRTLSTSQLWQTPEDFFSTSRALMPTKLWKAVLTEQAWGKETRAIRNKPNLDKTIDKRAWKKHEWPRIFEERTRKLTADMSAIGLPAQVIANYVEQWR